MRVKETEDNGESGDGGIVCEGCAGVHEGCVVEGWE